MERNGTVTLRGENKARDKDTRLQSLNKYFHVWSQAADTLCTTELLYSKDAGTFSAITLKYCLDPPILSFVGTDTRQIDSSHTAPPIDDGERATRPLHYAYAWRA